MAISRERFLVAAKDDRGAWQRKCQADYWPNGAGFSMPLVEGTTERDQVEGACLFLRDEKAAAFVDLECGLRVSRY